MRDEAARQDWIRERCIARAEQLGMTGYGIAKASGWKVAIGVATDFLKRGRAIRSDLLCHVLKALDLDVRLASQQDYAASDD